MTQAEATAVLVLVKQNQRRLDACKGHDFSLQAHSGPLPRYRCSRCLGEVDAQAQHWYALGRRHALVAA